MTRILVACLIFLGEACLAQVPPVRSVSSPITKWKLSSGDNFSDTFAGTVGTLLENHLTTSGGYAWSNYGGGGNFTITAQGDLTNSLTSFGFVSGHPMANANQTASINFTQFSPQSGDEIELCVRFQPGTDFAHSSCYFVSWIPFNIGGVLRLYLRNAGSLSNLAEQDGLQVGTNLTLVANGTSLTIKTNGVTCLTATDSTISSAGFIGISGALLRGGSDGYLMTIDNLNVTSP